MITRISLVVFILLFPVHTSAADLFRITVNSGGQSFSAGFPDAETAIDQLDSGVLGTNFPTYSDPQSTAFGAVNFRGLPMSMSYPTAGSTALVLNVPSLGISETFNGATRDESNDLLVAFLKGNLDGVNPGSAQRIFRELARVSPVDPVAGNPNSLMAKMVADDFAAGTSFGSNNFVSDISNSDAGAGSNEVGIDVSTTQLDLAGNDASTQTINISYKHRFESDARKQLKLRLPLTYSDIENAKLVRVALGTSYTFPAADTWLLTIGGSYGVTGSDDLAGGAGMFSFALASRYVFSLSNFQLELGNMVGHYESNSVSLGDFDADPGIGNSVFRNGLMGAKPVTLLGLPGELQMFLIDTRYTGDELFTEHYNELGLSIGLRQGEEGSLANHIKLGLTYLTASEDIDGFKVNFGYRF